MNGNSQLNGIEGKSEAILKLILFSSIRDSTLRFLDRRVRAHAAVWRKREKKS